MTFSFIIGMLIPLVALFLMTSSPIDCNNVPIPIPVPVPMALSSSSSIVSSNDNYNYDDNNENNNNKNNNNNNNSPVLDSIALPIYGVKTIPNNQVDYTSKKFGPNVAQGWYDLTTGTIHLYNPEVFTQVLMIDSTSNVGGGYFGLGTGEYGAGCFTTPSGGPYPLGNVTYLISSELPNPSSFTSSLWSYDAVNHHPSSSLVVITTNHVYHSGFFHFSKVSVIPDNAYNMTGSTSYCLVIKGANGNNPCLWGSFGSSGATISGPGTFFNKTWTSPTGTVSWTGTDNQLRGLRINTLV